MMRTFAAYVLILFVSSCFAEYTTPKTNSSEQLFQDYPLESDFDCSSLPDGNYRNPADSCSETFFSCFGGTSRQMTCPGQTKFDSDANTCQFQRYIASCGGNPLHLTTVNTSQATTASPAPGSGFECGQMDLGNYPDPKNDCSKTFFTCAGGYEGLVRDCPGPTFYDKELDQCLFRHQVPACGGSHGPSETSSANVVPTTKQARRRRKKTTVRPGILVQATPVKGINFDESVGITTSTGSKGLGEPIAATTTYATTTEPTAQPAPSTTLPEKSTLVKSETTPDRASSTALPTTAKDAEEVPTSRSLPTETVSTTVSPGSTPPTAGTSQSRTTSSVPTQPKGVETTSESSLPATSTYRTTAPGAASAVTSGHEPVPTVPEGSGSSSSRVFPPSTPSLLTTIIMQHDITATLKRIAEQQQARRTTASSVVDDSSTTVAKVPEPFSTNSSPSGKDASQPSASTTIATTGTTLKNTSKDGPGSPVAGGGPHNLCTKDVDEAIAPPNDPCPNHFYQCVGGVMQVVRCPGETRYSVTLDACLVPEKVATCPEYGKE